LDLADIGFLGEMAQSSIVATLSRQVFKRDITSALFAHSFSSSSFRSPSLFFSRKIHFSVSLSSQTAMGETPVAVDAGMDAVQRRLMFDDEYVSLSFSISSTPFRSVCLFVSLIYVQFVELSLVEYVEERIELLGFFN
jgi:hypothetical protein